MQKRPRLPGIRMEAKKFAEEALPGFLADSLLPLRL
jgi:hypothetical protein